MLQGVAAPAAVQRAGVAALSMMRRAGLMRLAMSRMGETVLPSVLVAGARLVETMAPRGFPRALARMTPARGGRRLRVGFLEGCVNRWMFAQVNEATVRLLSGAGCEVVVPEGQACCGALHAHSGDRKGARGLARANIEAFEAAGPFDAIVVNAAGCGSTMKDYGRLLDGPEGAEFSGKVRDALELLAEIGAPPAVRDVNARVAYQDACHLAHAQKIRSQPRDLLARVPGLSLVPLSDSDRCCGSAGIYNLLHPEVSQAILEPKLRRLRDSGADVAAAANPGCLLQLASGVRAAGLPLRVVHPLELLDEASRPETAPAR
jgi:glycolate oxidase iron-sulfur subunit